MEVLGRKDDGSPPMILLGIDEGIGLPGGAAAHRQKVLHELCKLQGALMGRRVLLVERDQGADRGFAEGIGLAGAVVDLVRPWAAAVLVHRTATRRFPSHFKVLASSTPGLSAGAHVRDPTIIQHLSACSKKLDHD